MPPCEPLLDALREIETYARFNAGAASDTGDINAFRTLERMARRAHLAYDIATTAEALQHERQQLADGAGGDGAVVVHVQEPSAA